MRWRGSGTGEYHDLEVGYTKTVAGYMADELGCDTFEIQPADPYPHDYAQAAPGARVSDAGLAVYECDAEEDAGRQQAHDWLAGFGLVEA